MTSSSSLIVILLADGFDEAEAGLFIGRLRAAGLSVQVVGLSVRPVAGAHDLTLKLDDSMETVCRAPKRVWAVIIPGGAAHVARLQADPRVHDLLHRVLDQGGHLVTTPGSRALLYGAGLWPRADCAGVQGSIIHFNGDTCLDAFICDLGKYFVAES
ncbi:MAG: DJ-1/PfpI family protein [Anaerolineae bacterium]